MAKHWMDTGGIQNRKSPCSQKAQSLGPPNTKQFLIRFNCCFFSWYQTGGESSRENTFYKKATSLLTIYSNMYQNFKQVILNLE